MRKPLKCGVPEVDQLFRKLRKQGARIEKGGAHWKVFGPQGQGPVIISGSKPKYRTMKNAEAFLKRSGFQL